MSRRRPGSILGATPSTGSSSGVWTLSQAAQQIGDSNWKGYSDLQNRSVKFDSTRLVELQRTPASAGNRRTNTISLWIKRAETSTTYFFSVADAQGVSEPSFFIGFRNDKLRIIDTNTTTHFLDSAEVFRDFSAWYHLVIAIDTTLPTAANRIKAWSNGVPLDLTDTSGGGPTFPAQNDQIVALNDTKKHSFGVNRYATGTGYHNYYLAEAYFVDGEALGPENFGELDHNTGVWSPKKYTGNFGTNGFYLPFDHYTETEGFNAVLYAGTGSVQDIRSVGFKPDIVWIRNKTNAYSYALFDSLRGIERMLWSETNSAQRESGDSYGTNSLTEFLDDGFEVTTDIHVNQNGSSYVAWCWEAGDSTVSNTDGSTTSSVRANNTTGLSVIQYTGNQGSATIGHGLDSTPDFIIIKAYARTADWAVWHSSTPTLAYKLHTKDGGSSSYFTNSFSSQPDSSVFSVIDNGNGPQTNSGSDLYIAYCWTEKSGYSKFGSYTGNGSSSGPVVDLGFRPAFLLVKGADSADRAFVVHDNIQDTTNPNSVEYWLDDNNQKSEARFNLTDTGFEVIDNRTYVNADGETYIYAAFADTRDFALWRDQSGNANDWQPVNHLSDTQQDTASDNFCTLNPLDTGGNNTVVPTEGNLKMTGFTNNSHIRTTQAITSGKYYWEITSRSASPNFHFGVSTIPSLPAFGNNYLGGASGTWGYWPNTTGSNSARWRDQTTDSFTNLPRVVEGDVMMFAVDADNGKIWLGKNGSWFNSGNPAAGTGSLSNNLPTDGTPIFPHFMPYDNGTGHIANFGQKPFEYTPPTGFETIRTGNLPRPVIGSDSDEKAGNYFNTVLYTGNASTQAITGVGFQPDFVWLKGRSATHYHGLYDIVRGTGGSKGLYSNTDEAEGTNANFQNFVSFDSDGFTLGSTASTNNINSNSATYAAWCWKAGGAPVSNTDGSIASQVSANTDSGFSIVSYTLNDSTFTVGHGLNQAPEVIIAKNRETTNNWDVYHKDVGAGYRIRLNTSNVPDASTTVWNNTAPTNSVFSGDSSWWSDTTGDMIAYCWHSVEGFSKFGSYIGNNSADGTFVYTGFRPAWVMIRRTDAARDWYIKDFRRPGDNRALSDGGQAGNDGRNANLLANDNAAEQDAFHGAFLFSNGFKLSTAESATNADGGTYIYMAFAEAPQKFSRSR